MNIDKLDDFNSVLFNFLIRVRLKLVFIDAELVFLVSVGSWGDFRFLNDTCSGLKFKFRYRRVKALFWTLLLIKLRIGVS